MVLSIVYRGTQNTISPTNPNPNPIINISKHRFHRQMHLEQHSQDRSEIPRLARAQRLNCLRVQREFIQEIIENEDLGPCQEIEYFFNSSNQTPSVDFTEDLINTSIIILKLAFTVLGDLYAYGVFFNNRETKWEEIEVTSNYWQQKWQKNYNYYKQIYQQ